MSWSLLSEVAARREMYIGLMGLGLGSWWVATRSPGRPTLWTVHAKAEQPTTSNEAPSTAKMVLQAALLFSAPMPTKQDVDALKRRPSWSAKFEGNQSGEAMKIALCESVTTGKRLVRRASEAALAAADSDADAVPPHLRSGV